MNKWFLILIWLFGVYGCQTKYEPKTTLADTIDAHIKANEIVEQAVKNALFDTVGISEAPIKIISAKPVNREYSNYRNVALKYKNVSNKTITAIKFSWYGKNAFGEDADMGIYKGVGGGFTEHSIKPGAIGSGEWEVLSRDLKKIVIAWPREVVFSDGTKWKSK